MSKWKMLKLRDVCVNKLEYGSGASAVKYDGCFRYIRITDINEFGSLNSEKVSPNVVDDKYLLNDEDLLLARSGATVGKSFLYRNEYGESIYAGYLIRVVLDKKIVVPKFIYYFTKSERYKKFIDSNSKVVAQPNINAKQYSNMLIPLPPIEEQRSIADILDKASKLIDLRKQQLEKMDLLVKSKFIDMFGDPVTNQKGWEVKKLIELSVLITKGSSPTWQGIKYTNDTNNILFVTSENVREGYLDLSKAKYLDHKFNEIQTRSILKKNDMLINIVGASIGRAALFNLNVCANINQAVALVRCKDAINLIYLNYFLNSPKALQMYWSMQSEVARANLSLKDIGNLSIVLPCRSEQNKFASFVEQVEKQKTVMQKSLEKMETNYKALMQEYF